MEFKKKFSAFERGSKFLLISTEIRWDLLSSWWTSRDGSIVLRKNRNFLQRRKKGKENGCIPFSALSRYAYSINQAGDRVGEEMQFYVEGGRRISVSSASSCRSRCGTMRRDARMHAQRRSDGDAGDRRGT